MAIKEKTIGAITVSNEIELVKGMYGVHFYDERFKSNGFLALRKETVIREFHLRGKSRGVISFYYGNEDEEHELTFEEFEENLDYRDEFDQFVQDLIIERLNVASETITITRQSAINEMYNGHLGCRIKEVKKTA